MLDWTAFLISIVITFLFGLFALVIIYINKGQKISAKNIEIIVDNRNKILKQELQEVKENLKINNLKHFINKQIINNLVRKNNMLLNSYKILYFRKISNIILDIILKNYNSSLYKTEKIFIDDTKPKYKQNFFPIIIAKEKIKNIEINKINLLLDYLMFVKDFTSSFIHLVEKCDIQIEILFDLFGKGEIKKENDNYLISSSFLINSLFNEEVNENNKRINEEINKKINDIDNINTPIRDKNKKNILDNQIIDNTNNNIDINKEKNDGNNSSENGFSTNEEINDNGGEELKTNTTNIIRKEKNLKSNLFKQKEIKNDLEILDKDVLFIKIDDIINNLQKYSNNTNFQINDIEDKIHQLKLNAENILKDKDDLTENELLKVNFIIELNNIDLNEIFYIKKFNKINGEFIFEKWKKTFNENYKGKEEFKQLVIYEENIKLKEIEYAARTLIVENEISIFCEDPGDFKNYKIEILKTEKFKNYNSRKK